MSDETPRTVSPRRALKTQSDPPHEPPKSVETAINTSGPLPNYPDGPVAQAKPAEAEADVTEEVIEDDGHVEDAGDDDEEDEFAD